MSYMLHFMGGASFSGGHGPACNPCPPMGAPRLYAVVYVCNAHLWNNHACWFATCEVDLLHKKKSSLQWIAFSPKTLNLLLQPMKMGAKIWLYILFYFCIVLYLFLYILIIIWTRLSVLTYQCRSDYQKRLISSFASWSAPIVRHVYTLPQFLTAADYLHRCDLSQVKVLRHLWATVVSFF